MFGDRRFGRTRIHRETRRGSSFQKGDLKYVILDLLKDKPRHGYEIIQAIEELSHGLYKPSPGAVYPTLQMLEEMGYATAEEQDGKKVYTITEGGKEFLVKQKDLADGVRSQIKNKWGFKKIGRMAQLMREYHDLESLIGRGVRSLDDDKTERIRQILIQTGRAIEEILEE